MIPSINDFTSHWKFCDFSTKWIGILFGENILVYNGSVINLTKLFNDNGRIHNAIDNKEKIYVLLDNNNLYEIEIKYLETYNLICKDVKNICSYIGNTYILKNNGEILNVNLVAINSNISIVTNIPRSRCKYDHVYICDKNNEFHTLQDMLLGNKQIIQQINKTNNVADICVVEDIIIILYNDTNTFAIYNLDHEMIMDNDKFKNVNCIGAISHCEIGIMYDNNNVVVYEGYGIVDMSPYKSISIPNSPYCAKFNTQNIPYYPKYFMNRFMAFIMSVKYGCNIKLPKYLYFMIADCLR